MCLKTQLKNIVTLFNFPFDSQGNLEENQKIMTEVLRSVAKQWKPYEKYFNKTKENIIVFVYMKKPGFVAI